MLYQLAIEFIDQILIAIKTTTNQIQVYEGPRLINECYQASLGIRFELEVGSVIINDAPPYLP